MKKTFLNKLVFLILLCFAYASQSKGQNLSKATFAGGCFWHLDSAFTNLNGVIETQVGFTGGDIPFPKYRQVSTGTTGHAEAIQIKYDSDVISYEKLLEAFWSAHNPSYPYRQKPGPGAQFQSIIFFQNKVQKEKATLFLSGKLSTKTISTKITRVKPFYPAEGYHQDYFYKKLKNCPILKR